MIIRPTRAQIAASETLRDALLAKAIQQFTFEAEALTHTEVQYCLTNNIAIDDAELYSPVLTLAQIEELVPLTWPQSEIAEERVMWKDYTKTLEVTGGYVLQYRGSYWSGVVTQNINRPTAAQLVTWVNRFSGFLTKAEVDAILITI